MRHYVYQIVVIVSSILLVACAKPVVAQGNSSNTEYSNSQEQVQKYEREDDFLYEEKIVDVVVDPQTGQVEEKPPVVTEDNTEQEHPLEDL